eukprot:CAMPEP_0197053028 /NCGR_PEP_ID=MMETSP1384-20130603/27391_1 /TAXON_ID=29189 /ORGANISM="Ammonia sp." /LENGTH=337 /DNA_ID=CAMNT_0042485865 /DNA_START=32 /DNA_END=1045 /DNA_ORIENTATION=+
MSEEEEFVTKLTQIAVVQISEELGNDGIRESALNTLSEVTQRFIQEIGSMAASFATASGRTECNYFDIEAALNEIGYDIEELAKFENNSYPLQSAIDIENLEISNPHSHDSHKHENSSKNEEQSSPHKYGIDLDGIKINELQQSIAKNECTRNGTVIFDSQKNILEILEKQTSSNSSNKRKKNKAGKSKSGKRMKHIPAFCPDYPDNLLYKHTPIYYKPMAHHYEHDDDEHMDTAKQKEIEQRKLDNFEKTRQVVIDYARVFSAQSHENNKNDGDRKHHQNEKKRKLSGLQGVLLNNGPSKKRQKLNGEHKKKVAKDEADDANDNGVEILQNPWAAM